MGLFVRRLRQCSEGNWKILERLLDATSRTFVVDPTGPHTLR